MSETKGVQIIDLESALRRSLEMRNPNQAAQAILSTESEIRGLREVNADLLAEAGLRGFLAEALIIADTEGMSDDTELPVWPNNNAKKHPPLTVGALRALGAAIAKAEGRS